MKRINCLTMILLAALPCSQTSAAPAGCGPLIRDAKTLAARISSASQTYWSYRESYLASSASTTSTEKAMKAKIAEQGRSKLGLLKGRVSEDMANFATLVAAAQTQKCLEPREAQALREPVVTDARRINFDRLPSSAPLESVTAEQAPPMMPRK